MDGGKKFFALLRSKCDGGMWVSKSEERVIKEEPLAIEPVGQGKNIKNNQLNFFFVLILAIFFVFF